MQKQAWLLFAIMKKIYRRNTEISVYLNIKYFEVVFGDNFSDDYFRWNFKRNI